MFILGEKFIYDNFITEAAWEADFGYQLEYGADNKILDVEFETSAHADKIESIGVLAYGPEDNEEQLRKKAYNVAIKAWKTSLIGRKEDIRGLASKDDIGKS